LEQDEKTPATPRMSSKKKRSAGENETACQNEEKPLRKVKKLQVKTVCQEPSGSKKVPREEYCYDSDVTWRLSI